MILGENIGSVFNEGKEIRRVYSLGKLVWERAPIDYSIRPFTVKAINDTVSVRISNSFKYSINGNEWVQSDSTNTIQLNKKDIVSIITTNTTQCSIQGLSDVSGNIMSLIYGDDFIGQTVWLMSGQALASKGFFYHSDIRNAKNLVLPATTLSERSYENMFAYCDWLETAPALPATTLTYRCYHGMFYHCSHLTSAPELPSTTLAPYCYDHMFWSCNNIIPPVLPATTLAPYCYAHMYRDAHLTTPPVLPATTLAEGCYESMFYECDFTTAPVLPATTLAPYCYENMFLGCEYLTSAPELPAETLVEGCYEYMFYDCPSLKYIKCHATTDIEDGVYAWTENVKKYGTLVCKQLDGGKNPLEDYIPSTWTVEYLT